MTIIQNKNLSSTWKNENGFRFLIPTLILMLVFVSISGVFVYNKTVSINHEIDGIKNDLRDVEIKNAELKNKVSDMLSQDKLQSFASGKALVLDKNPEYLIADQPIVQQSKEIGLAR